ncbi:hypothetical protein [Rhodopirellula bahusiensis]
MLSLNNSRTSLNVSPAWCDREIHQLTPESFLSLLNNEIPAIRIPKFADADECDLLAAGIEFFGFHYYKDVYPPIGRIGITQYEHGRNRNSYFASVREASRKQREALADACDPIERMRQTLRRVFGGASHVAYESEMRCSYFAGLIRQINIALLHVDWASLSAPNWEISKALSQLAWNLFVRVPENGGECVVHDRLWVPCHEEHLIPGSYGYDHKVVENSENVALNPEVGDVLLFNSQNFHQVNAGGNPGERLTISSFIGLMPNGRLVLWS